MFVFFCEYVHLRTLRSMFVCSLRPGNVTNMLERFFCPVRPPIESPFGSIYALRATIVYSRRFPVHRRLSVGCVLRIFARSCSVLFLNMFGGTHAGRLLPVRFFFGLRILACKVRMAFLIFFVICPIDMLYDICWKNTESICRCVNSIKADPWMNILGNEYEPTSRK